MDINDLEPIKEVIDISNLESIKGSADINKLESIKEISDINNVNPIQKGDLSLAGRHNNSSLRRYCKCGKQCNDWVLCSKPQMY